MRGISSDHRQRNFGDWAHISAVPTSRAGQPPEIEYRGPSTRDELKYHESTQRRDLFWFGGQAAISAFTAGAIGGREPFARRKAQLPPGSLEQRVAALLQAFDAQGNHRTGTEVDNASAQWLAYEARLAGAETSLEPFSLSRVDPQSCYLRIGEHRIDGVPLFDAGFTGPEGVEGTIGPLGSDAEIALVESEVAEPGESSTQRPDEVAEARRSRHKAIVVLTRGVRPGLYLLNASRFLKPFGPPGVQVSDIHSEWLQESAAVRAKVTLVAYVRRTTAQAFNVTAKIVGSVPALGPVVLMAPRSAWWQSVSEQGSRLVCWLEAIRVLAAAGPARGCLFVALSGHELGFLGLEPYIKRRPDLIKRAHAWIFFGSDIGSPRHQNRIHASDDALEQWAVAVMEREGLAIDAKVGHDATARGEAGTIQRGGGRCFTVVCPSDFFHSPADRWPDAVDVGLLARYARAFANGALQLANQPRISG